MNAPDQLIDDLRLLEPPEPWRIHWGLVLASLALLVGVWWLIRRWRANAARRARFKAIRGAHEDALTALERLFAMVSEGRSRDYGIESSAILRRYLEARFGLLAPLRSTEEFLHEAQHAPQLTSSQQDALGEFLRCCDLLKFARTSADRAELEALHYAAVGFVTETRRTASGVLA